MKFNLYFQYYHNTYSLLKQPPIQNTKDFQVKTLQLEPLVNNRFLYATVTPFLADSLNNFPFKPLVSNHLTQDLISLFNVCITTVAMLLLFREKEGLLGLCSSRAQWPLVPNFCLRATRKSQIFHTNHMLGTLDFTVSEHWAPFNFP